MQLKANKEEAERLKRLNRVWKKINTNLLNTKINEMLDDKGDLKISWNTQPTQKEKEYVEKLWAEENECCVNHIVNKNVKSDGKKVRRITTK